MAKAKKSVFFCQNCGHEESKWLGQCPMCKEWNSFVEECVTTSNTAAVKAAKEIRIVPLSEVKTENEERVTTEIKELDRVLGGGIVPGSLILVGGDPGIGKSTLLLQVCQKLAKKERKVLYISGEESLRQIKLRAQRMGEFNDHLLLLCETNLELIRNVIEKEKPDTVIIDSIQTMYSEEVRTGKCVAGQRGNKYADAACKRAWDFDFYCRTCYKRRNCRRSKSIGTYGRYGSVF